MRRLMAVFASFGVMAAVCVAEGANKLVNGNLDLTVGTVYYDGSDPTLADDVPGWLISLGAADGSYVLISPEAGHGHDLDMANGPAAGGISTAPVSRPRVAAGSAYTASVTYDNYFAPTTTTYFIDWFDDGGNLLSSSGGLLGDPNGPFGYAPYDQEFTITATAPIGAARAGVRFETGNASYAGLAADNFSLVPEPTFAALLITAALGIMGLARRRT